MRFIRFVISLALLLALALGVMVYLGFYEVAADKPHTRSVAWLVEQARDRAIEVRARGVQVPRLDDEAMVRDGASHYQELCAGCHMAPGETDTSFPDALNPRPPRLTQPSRLNPAEQFWVIKHGIKMSGMPAWGAMHDDQSIWNIVALLQRLPTLNPEQYKALLPPAGSGAAPQAQGAEGAPVQEPVPPGPGAAPSPADPSAPPADAATPDEQPKPKPDDPEQHETRP